MPGSDNNIPTDDRIFVPMGPSEIPSPIADIEKPSPYAENDPARPVDDSIKIMAAQRKLLMRILALCKEPASAADVNREVERLKEFQPSVYTASDLCAELERAGGIKRVNADGSAYDMSGKEPSIIEEDGIRYYVANEPVDMYWSTQPAGITVLDDDKPLDRAREFFDADPDLLPLYKRILLLCDGAGSSIAELSAAVDNDPLIQSPRLYTPFFVDRLEQCDAIEWENVWLLTDVGREALTLLSGVNDD